MNDGTPFHGRSTQPMLTPYTMAGLSLSNRVVMAPLTRSRATNAELAPTDLHMKYYAQRASAGLIISEGVWISRDAVGWNDVPGLFTDTQVRAWSAVTEAVHAAGGLIFAQLWHTGSSSHPDFFSGTPPLAPSPVNPGLRSHTPSGLKPTVVPRAMTRADIAATVTDYAQAATNAQHAGFDGVQLQAGFSYLISQFLNPATNLRTDEYGGTVENRARLLFDIIDAVGERIDLNRVGVKAGPAWAEHGAFQSTDDTLETSNYVIERLNDYPISHLLLMTAMADLSGRPLAKLQGRGTYQHYRPRFGGTLIANVGITPEAGNVLIDDGLVDLVALGQPFIANPDLPARLAAGATLTTPDPSTFYTGGANGYTNYLQLPD
ncbi:MAG TPA: alkene reductase [Mycobacterium sp.]|jgi:N-ethylmaleimide reductase|nr:alkene reductase [Mycobacterium sp.]